MSSDSAEGQRAADFYTNLTHYSPPDLLNASSWDGRVPFANGDVAMYMAGGLVRRDLMTQFPDATGIGLLRRCRRTSTVPRPLLATIWCLLGHQK